MDPGLSKEVYKINNVFFMIVAFVIVVDDDGELY